MRRILLTNGEFLPMSLVLRLRTSAQLESVV